MSASSSSEANTETTAEAGQSFDAWSLANYYLSPIIPLLTEDGVSEIMVNRYDEIFVERYGELTRTSLAFDSEQQLGQAIIQVANALGQIADPLSHPVLDARLADGSRVCGVLSPTSTRGSSLTIRVFPRNRLTTQALVERGAINAQMLGYLRLVVAVHANCLVSGGTGSGKTTLLNALSSFIPKQDRVVTVEDTQELVVDVDNLVCLEAPHIRRPELDAQRIDLAFLIKSSLRMRPTRLFVGEIRDAMAATAFLHAINTGHSGCCSTVHANSTFDALTRLQTLVAGGGGALPYDVIRDQVRSNINVLIHAERTPRHGRRVVQIAELRDSNPVILWSWDYAKAQHIANPEAITKSEILRLARLHGVDGSGHS
jgi:pilus assembly protein CpaF